MLSDTQLQKNVLAELNYDARVPAGHIGVTAEGGIITLSGHAENYADKHAAEVAARRVKGVKGVSEEIEVRLNHLGKRTDGDIVAAVLNCLAWDVSVPHTAITPTVEDGWVTLTGQVRWRFEKDAAGQDVQRLAGVVGVSNDITIEPRVNAENVEEDITRALHRSWLVDPKLVTVATEGGTVQLSGVVPTEHDRSVAEAAAWAYPGTEAVENLITVD